MSLLEQFCHEMQPLLKGTDSVHGAVSVCASYEEAGRQVAQLLRERQLLRVIAAARPELDLALNSLRETLARFASEKPENPPIEFAREIPTQFKLGDSSLTFREYAGFDAGIGGADVLIAESATIGLRMGAYESRALSLLPPTHIVIAPASRLMARIHDALGSPFTHLDSQEDSNEGESDAHASSPTLTLISGPSRTADIEKILVLPAHGPSQLFVWLVSEA